MLVLDDPEGADRLVDWAVMQDHPSTPVVVLMTRTTEAGLALEILRALGKRTELAGTPAYTAAVWQNVQIWLGVLPIERLTIANSDFLVPAAVRRLAGLPKVLVIHDPKGATADLNAELAGFKRPDASYVTKHTSPGLAGSQTPTPAFPASPTDAFPFFLPTCRKVLSAEQYAIVCAAYRDARSTVWLRDLHPDNPERYEVAAGAIRAILEPVADSHERLARARGIEHAFFDEGWLLRIDPARFMHATPRMQLAEIVSRVNWYANCELAATAALASLGLDSNTLSSLSADAIFESGSDGSHTVADSLQLGSVVRIPRALRAPLSAFWLDQHKALPVPNNGPLFRTGEGGRLSAKSIKTRLSRMALETGLPVASHWTPPADQRATNWMRRHGISLVEL